MHGFGLDSDRPTRIEAIVPCAVDREEQSRDVTNSRVLIIDDDAATRELLQRILRLEGFQAMTARTGEAGIELANLEDFDVILIELCLTDMSGTEVMSALRKVCSAGLVLISEFLTVQTVVEAMKLGAFDVLEKPVDIERLLAAVRAGANERNALSLSAALKQPSYIRVITAPRSVVERWVGYVIKVCNVSAADASGDFKTIEEWARRIAVSYSTLCETCRLLGTRPVDARDFARVLNALRAAIIHRCAPEVLLDVSNRRVLRGLSSKAGIDLELEAEHGSIYEFLTNQRFIHEGSEALRLIRAFTPHRSH